MKIILMNGGEVEKVFQTEGIAREKAWRQAGRTHALGTEKLCMVYAQKSSGKTNVRNKLEIAGRDQAALLAYENS